MLTLSVEIPPIAEGVGEGLFLLPMRKIEANEGRRGDAFTESEAEAVYGELDRTSRSLSRTELAASGPELVLALRRPYVGTLA